MLRKLAINVAHSSQCRDDRKALTGNYRSEHLFALSRRLRFTTPTTRRHRACDVRI